MKPRAVIANFSRVWPPMGGGQRRIFFLARELARAYDVVLVTPDRAGRHEVLRLAANLSEIAVPVEADYRARERDFEREVPASADLIYTLHWTECRTYQAVLAHAAAAADVVISTHPFSVPALLDVAGERPLVFDSQNVEAEQKKPLFATRPEALEAIRSVEARALAEARVTIACSDEDADNFAASYGVSRERLRIVKNGVDARGVSLPDEAERTDLRRRLGLDGRFVAVFGGSLHPPNYRAVERIQSAARSLPDVVFLILGSICRYEGLAATTLPNLHLLGGVDESLKWATYAVADIGLNPMDEGSGTNIKMFEYAAANLTILSTPFGARGSGLVAPAELVLAEAEAFADTLADLARRPMDELRARGRAARARVLAEADWGVIGARYRDAVDAAWRPAP